MPRILRFLGLFIGVSIGVGLVLAGGRMLYHGLYEGGNKNVEVMTSTSLYAGNISVVLGLIITVFGVAIVSGIIATAISGAESSSD